MGSRSRDREGESWVRDREIERERAGFEIERYGEERASRERELEMSGSRQLERRLRSREEGCVDGEKGCVWGY